MLLSGLSLRAWCATLLAVELAWASPTAEPVRPRARVCRVLPGDRDWPKPDEWKALNTTVGGRLIATVPAADPCHDPNYNAILCEALKEEWDFAKVHFESPSEIMQPWFQNGTCDPFHPASKPCTLGNYVSYSINVSNVDHIVTGLKFAKKHNVRLAIKNTGHDFAGKSTAKGGLGIWTHNMNQISVNLNYSSPWYKGPAIKLGAGTQAADAYQAAHAVGHRVMGGSCPTVGLAGGFTQGGGHSLLSSQNGLAADSVLEWEVVTVDGELVTATPYRNADLYWALSGGGGGTWGVVVSLTTKLYKDGPTAGASLTFASADFPSLRAYWDAVNKFQTGVASIADGGAVVLYTATPVSFLMFTTAPDIPATTLTRQFAYIDTYLSSANVTHNLTVTQDPTYYDHFVRYYGPLPLGIWEVSHIMGSRLIPRSVVQSPQGSQALTDAYANITANGDFIIVSIAINASRAAPAPGGNAVHPAWRSALLHTLSYSPWDWSAPDIEAEMARREDVLTNQIEPLYVKLSPGSGSYLNEGNFNMKNALQEFYGPNLPRLAKLKKKIDPTGLLWARTAVGSEEWAEDSQGRLCKV